MTEPTNSDPEIAGNASATRVRLAEIEQELLTDPWQLLRRACQNADYGAPTDPKAPGA